MMMESNYFYSGIPLLQYCREHGIKYNTIIKGISRKRNHPKFKDYSEQEIVNMCVENYGTSIKYTYKGISLRQY